MSTDCNNIWQYCSREYLQSKNLFYSCNIQFFPYAFNARKIKNINIKTRKETKYCLGLKK